MKPFEIVAHRGIPTEAPENTLASFERAVALGADAIELDVRLTADHIPVVYHYFYLQETTSASGPVFDFTFEQLREIKVFCQYDPSIPAGRIPTLGEVLESLCGRIGLEIEIKGPEPEAPKIIGGLLNDHRRIWDTIEVTSYQPALLLAIQKFCPGIAADLLYPRSESWMGLDVVTYEAIHLARTAHARAVHLHPTQVTARIVETARQQGIEVHAWDVNDEKALKIVTNCGIPRLCTDNFKQARAFRDKMT